MHAGAHAYGSLVNLTKGKTGEFARLHMYYYFAWRGLHFRIVVLGSDYIYLLRCEGRAAALWTRLTSCGSE